ncbi:MAG: hypothetical protein D6759_01720 [Chloroflexi bacterium]|nr:MAG: hypothetical protein D6759_01720 [Chloroflexota bacterium]
MTQRISQWLSDFANFMAQVRGLPHIIAIVLVILNFIFGFIPALEWWAKHDVLLHIALILAFSGSLLASAL